jgi:hypothetical protein
MLVKNYELWGKQDQAKKYMEILSNAEIDKLDATATP